MAEMSDRPLRVFLCYATGDKPKVRELYKRLSADGLDPWFDEEKLLPGQNWRDETSRTVRTSDVVIVCLSVRSIKEEGQVQKNFKLALDIAEEKPDGTIFIIPVRLDECELPDRLKSLQAVNLFEKGGYKKLLEALCVRAESAKVNQARPQASAADFKITSESKVLPAESEGKSGLSNENPSQEKPSKRSMDTTILVALIGAGATIIAAILGFKPFIALFEQTPTSTVTVAVSTSVTPPATFTPPVTSTATLIPITQTATPAPTLTPLPAQIADSKGIAMALVPAGEFTMGNEKGLSSEKTEHRVFLGDFYIDIYEVTNIAYAVCVDVRACQPPVSRHSRKTANYYTDPDSANFPVVYINWEMAQAYCTWRQGRLPTEAEWEKTARGGDQRLYPTGAVISCTSANYCRDNTVEVGRYHEPPGPFGVFDMAGNVAEWVADWYGAGYYDASPLSNPTGPATGQMRVVRGGSFDSKTGTDLQTSSRDARKPDAAFDYIGFRCVRKP